MKHPILSGRRGLLVGTLAAGGAVTLLAVFGPVSGVVPSLAAGDDPADADGERCVDSTAQSEAQALGAQPAQSPSDTRTVDASGAGTVTYRVGEGSLNLVDAEPADGWSVEVEDSSGRELDIDFRSGAQRVQVDIELEDGRPRERVRLRDDDSDEEVRFEDGVVVETELDDDSDDRDDVNDGDDEGRDHDRDDNSGPGSASSGRDDDHDDGSDDD